MIKLSGKVIKYYLHFLLQVLKEDVEMIFDWLVDQEKEMQNKDTTSFDTDSIVPEIEKSKVNLEYSSSSHVN